MSNHDTATLREVQRAVARKHRELDETKEWAETVLDWLAEERDRFEEEGDREAAKATEALMLHVDSVYGRVELGDRHLRPPDSNA